MKVLNVKPGNGYQWINGDSCEIMPALPAESVHFEIYSPPFSSLYTYSNSDRDLGNSKSDEQFFEHFHFITTELFRILKPGRIMAVHCMNLPTSKERDGFIGIKDFRGELIREFQSVGFIYHAEVCIWKNPVTAMQRTKALGLLHKQIKKDSCMSRMGIPDYVVIMRKPGENSEPVTHTNETYPVSEWQEVASPIWQYDFSRCWWDINQSDTLNVAAARDGRDERHICPLQLPVIERLVNLYTNPNDIVFSPFGGISSEIYQSVKMGRRGVAIELKESYWKAGCDNLNMLDMEKQQMSIFDFIGVESQ
jgi:DNA modification methylase